MLEERSTIPTSHGAGDGKKPRCKLTVSWASLVANVFLKSEGVCMHGPGSVAASESEAEDAEASRSVASSRCVRCIGRCWGALRFLSLGWVGVSDLDLTPSFAEGKWEATPPNHQPSTGSKLNHGIAPALFARFWGPVQFYVGGSVHLRNPKKAPHPFLMGGGGGGPV